MQEILTADKEKSTKNRIFTATKMAVDWDIRCEIDLIESFYVSKRIIIKIFYK
jgi:hypothetical protein